MSPAGPLPLPAIGTHRALAVLALVLLPRLPLALGGALGSALDAAEGDHDEVIIVADDGAAATAGVPVPALTAAAAASGPAAPTAVYQAVWTHPEQTFVDSDLGPLPLWTETVYDADGNPRPRFPDDFTKAFLDDPCDATALAYLESQRVRARRYLQASQIMQGVAVAMGYVTPDAFRPPRPQSPNSRALVPPEHLRREDWGTPVLSPEQARVDGLSRAEIPETPGKATTREVEVLFLWDHRCPFSMRAFHDYARFGEDIFQRELGPRVMTISLDNDSIATFTQLDFLEYTGMPTRHLENWLDQTGLAATLHVRYTPTYVFIDRRSGRIVRGEGLQDLAWLRATLLDLVGHGEARWEDAQAAWFRPTAPAPGQARSPGADEHGPAPANASPVQPPSRAVRAWDPDGVQDR
jgi:hypothetical protein